MKRVAIEVDGRAPRGAAWHTELLKQMTSPTEERPAALSNTTRERLMEYLGFRHRFRSIYGHMLRYDIMRHLVLGCRETLNAVTQDLHAFMAELERNGSA
jgi:hypothetical protein